MIKLAYNGEKETLAMKDAFAQTLTELMQTDDSVVYLDADLMNSMGTLKLVKQFVGRAIDCGVQEANMVGVAAGMSAAGCKPFVHTFGPFAARRCYDQVFMSVGYAKNNVVIIGSDAGVTAAFNGGTHMPFEDIAMYRVIPESTIFDVTDSAQLAGAMKIAKDLKGVTYIRTPRKNCTAVYEKGTEFAVAKANVLKDGTDVAIIACGIMVAEALNAAEQLEKDGISCAVIDAVTVKPLDNETILRYAQKCKLIATAENANIIGGLGGAVCELLCSQNPKKVVRIGVEDLYGQVGDEAFLRAEYKLTPKDIILKIKAAL